MKISKLLTQLGLLALFSAALPACGGTYTSLQPGDQAPFTRFMLHDGKMITTSQFKGRKTALIFWATSCSRSSQVLDDMNDWLRENGRKYSVAGISVSVDKADDQEKVLDRLAGRNTIYSLNGFSGNDIYDEAYLAYDVGLLPTIFAIDATGQILKVGSSTDVLNEAFGD